jgi:hypothetical protein
VRNKKGTKKSWRPKDLPVWRRQTLGESGEAP